MNKWIVLGLLVVIGGIGFWILNSNRSHEMADTHQHEEADIYTCPMHPEVKQNKPGHCPICHMTLVKVKKEKKSVIEVSDAELKQVGVQKYTVKKMNLSSNLPISGRFTSSGQIAFQIYEKELGEIKVGNKFIGHAASNPETDLEGKITTIDAYVDPVSRTIRVMGTLNSRSPNARVESSFHGQVVVDIPSVIAIPDDAILHTGKSDLVYLFKHEDSLEPHSVDLGVKVKGYYQVLKGLNEGDIVTTGANFLIDSEAKIRGIRD